MKKAILTLVFLCSIATSFAQTSADDMMSDFQKFKEQMYSNYKNYLGEINARYEQFLRAAWKSFEAEEPVPEPAPEPEPEPVVMEDPAPVIEDKMVEAVPVTVPEPKPAPAPVVKVENVPQPSVVTMNVSFYGSSVKVRFDRANAPKMSNTTEDGVADYWHLLCNGCCNNLLRDLFDERKNRDLCDWAYYNLCKNTAETISSNSDERQVLTAFLLCQSGFQVKLGRDNASRLHILLATSSKVYDHPYWSVNGVSYYLMDDKSGVSQLYVMQAEFPEEKPLRLDVTSANRLDLSPTSARSLKSERYHELDVTVQTNRNLIDFYDTYPTSYSNDDVMTRWWYYAMSPMEEEVRHTLYPALKAKLNGLSKKEQVERLLNFVQTAFVYEYDDKVWGGDRAFFAEETLYYPYCDCEDRSILFSRLVRDLVGLDVALLYYPGHLATAVAFDSAVRGDYLVINNRRFTVCDPTFINAPVGLTMTGMDNSSARYIVLKATE